MENTVRLIIEYAVWKEEHDGFMERFERYISLCAKYEMSCMIVLANDCMPPRNRGLENLHTLLRKAQYPFLRQQMRLSDRSILV